MADTRVLKTLLRKGVRVRVPSPAPPSLPATFPSSSFYDALRRWNGVVRAMRVRSAAVARSRAIASVR